MILVLGRPRSPRVPNLGCRGAESPGWFDVPPKNSAWDVTHRQARCCDEAANHQLPMAAAFWIIQIVSAEECSSLRQNYMQILCCTCSVILNVTATQYSCSLNSIYLPHWLVQWSHHCLLQSIAVHAHSSPLSLAARSHRCHTNRSNYINNGWTFSGQTSSYISADFYR